MAFTCDVAQESYLFDLISRREVAPPQHLLIMGLPVPGLCSDSSEFPWPSLVSCEPDRHKAPGELTDSEIKHLAGKGFHAASIGSFLMFVWSSSLVGRDYVSSQVVIIKDD